MLCLLLLADSRQESRHSERLLILNVRPLPTHQMRIYKLTPINPTYDGWRYSSFNGQVIVRAATEIDARQLASLAFSRMAPVIPGQETAGDPWSQGSQVDCAVFEDRRHPIDGLPEILEPKSRPQ